MHLETIPLIALIFMVGALCQLIAWRVRMPPILFLLITGMVAGPLLGAVRPEQLLGELFYPFVSLSVAIILFEGSLNLKIKEIRGLHVVVRNLVSFGMLITWLITTLSTKFLFEVSWEVAALFGAIMVVSGPTVVAPILRTVRPIESISNILKWESIVIDPIGASLAVLVFEFIVIGGGQEALGHTLVTFSQLLIIGGAIGLITGYLFGVCLRLYLIPEFLHNVCALGLVFTSFAIADTIQPESGLVTVTVFGVLLANMRDVDLKNILAFKETLSILLISVLFIILAARIDINGLAQLGWNAVTICLIIQLIARPVCVIVSTLGSTLSRVEKGFIAWVGPRGIVAAAISSLFAFKLENYGYEDAAILVPLTFTVIIFTVTLQSLTALPLAKFLRLKLPENDGFLIIGSNRLSRAIAKKLIQFGVRVMIADNSSKKRAEAYYEDIPVYRAEPLGEDAGFNLDSAGLGSLLALSANKSENIAATFYYRREFGRSNIYMVLPSPRVKNKSHDDSSERTISRLRCKTLFSEEVSYPLLAELHKKKAKIKVVSLDRKFDIDEFHEAHGKDAVPLFALDSQNKAYCFSPQNRLQPEEGWHILFLGGV